uniref:(California timema) hypothetical protein n=1 Tax=Timema californicum TaxID=61474 RepID=A0A7R9J0D6_TIMCA|nr:unnamed protein product [Timema californicum]
MYGLGNRFYHTFVPKQNKYNIMNQITFFVTTCIELLPKLYFLNELCPEEDTNKILLPPELRLKAGADKFSCHLHYAEGLTNTEIKLEDELNSFFSKIIIWILENMTNIKVPMKPL